MLILNREKVREILAENPVKDNPKIQDQLKNMDEQQVWNLLSDTEQSRMIELFFSSASKELGKCLYNAICKELVR